uniref:RNA pseudouridine synthase domain containing 1 n=1 Tax=Equus caballus TaxID=9796 RepID=A0A9L0RFU2_HORSE
MEPGSVENLCIVYRSRDFLVVNKHWDVRIDSKTWRETLTLQKQLRHRFPELADPDTYYGFRPDAPATRALQRPWPPRRGGPDVRPGLGRGGPALPHDAARLLSAHPHAHRVRGGLHL